MKDDEKGNDVGKESGEKGNVIDLKEKEEKSPLVPTEQEEELETVKLMPDEGAIVFKKEGMDLIVPTGENLTTDSEYFDEIINTITYMLYALEREDWKDEFISVLKKQIQKEDEDEHEAEVKRRRSHLKVIK
tara:strand:- start:2357 stop:2752 length:396 start_codon:yes stop_codon:yes gene_type:complete